MAIPVLKALGVIKMVILKVRGAAYTDAARLLEQLGRTEYKAAIKALKDAETSNDPQRERISAMTCLRQAVEKFQAAAASKGILTDMWSSAISDVVSPAHWADAEAKLLLASVYKEWKDEKLTRQYALEAVAAFNNYVAAMTSFNRRRSALPRSTGGEDRGIDPGTASQLEKEKAETKSALDQIGYGANLLVLTRQERNSGWSWLRSRGIFNELMSEVAGDTLRQLGQFLHEPM
jgi:hypothetical protein